MSRPMRRHHKLIAKTAILVLMLTPFVTAGTSGNDEGPVFCPPLNEFLTPTLLDFLLDPMFTSR